MISRTIVVFASAALVGTAALSATGTPALAHSTAYLAGSDRHTTSTLVAQAAYPDSATNVYLARGDVLADALSAGSFSDGPVLLVDRSGRFNLAARSYVSGLKLSGKVIALGGNSVVPQSVVDDIAGGKPTGRLQGATRLATSAEIARAAYPSGAAVVYLADGFGADGNGSADAVAGGALHDGPVLLVDKRSSRGVSSNTAAVAALQALHPAQVIALGGNAAVPQNLGQELASTVGAQFSRVYGANRYETAAAIATRAFPGKPNSVYIARGDVFADAVAASALKKQGPILLAPTTPNPAQNYAAGYIRAHQPASVIFLGRSFWDGNVISSLGQGQDFQITTPAAQPTPKQKTQQPKEKQQPGKKPQPKKTDGSKPSAKPSPSATAQPKPTHNPQKKRPQPNPGNTQPAPQPSASTRPTPRPAVTTYVPITEFSDEILDKVSAMIEKSIFEEINAKRVELGVPPLQRLPEADALAKGWSRKMIKEDFFRHSDDSEYDCAKLFESGFSKVGENIFRSYGNSFDTKNIAHRMVQGWINSPGHFENLSNRNFTHTGIGVAVSRNGKTIKATQNFAG